MANETEYFDKPQNEADKKNYYQGLDSGDKNNLGIQLSALLRETHKNKLSYKPSLFLYPQVDKQVSGKLISIYSGKEFELAEILMLDAQIDIQRQFVMENYSNELHGRPLSETEKEEIELAYPYNCEHVVPQSWFGKNEPMRGDLHHLFTCEVKCNSFRGNNKYFDFADYREVVRDECGKLENNLFEPERNKGIVARAVLYFVLRYPGEFSKYNAADIKMLIKWHQSEPVTLFELHRNQNIFKLQGNRNPVIDFPEWADILEIK